MYKEMYRQGDLLFILTDVAQEDFYTSAERVRHEARSVAGRMVYDMLKSKVTGHSHTVEGDVTLYQEDEGTFRLVAYGEFTVKHQEHRGFRLPAGVYEIRRQREVTGYVVD